MNTTKAILDFILPLVGFFVIVPAGFIALIMSTSLLTKIFNITLGNFLDFFFSAHKETRSHKNNKKESL